MEQKRREASYGNPMSLPLESRSAFTRVPTTDTPSHSPSTCSNILRGGFDPLRTLHIPLLSHLGLQPIAFADWGRTKGGDGDADWRADVGLGLGRLIGAPGLGGHLRLYAAKPVFNGESDRPWRFLLMLER